MATDALVGGVGVASAFAEVNVKYRRVLIEKLSSTLGTPEVRVGEPSASTTFTSSSSPSSLVLLLPIGEFRAGGRVRELQRAFAELPLGDLVAVPTPALTPSTTSASTTTPASANSN